MPLRLSVLALLVGSSACVATTVEARRLTVRDTSFSLDAPARAQLTDGAIVVFSRGLRVEESRVIGEGWRYTPTLRDSVAVSSVPVDSVACLVAFRMAVDPAKSAAQSVATAVIASFLLLIGYYAACVASRCLR
jgi:hypothetical protein